jgi:hypothetical protein
LGPQPKPESLDWKIAEDILGRFATRWAIKPTSFCAAKGGPSPQRRQKPRQAQAARYNRLAIRGSYENAMAIGNAQYQKSPTLKNAAKDATDFPTKLPTLKFTFVGGRAHLNVGRTEMTHLLHDLANAAHEGAPTLFYYEGHGLALNGDNRLMPVDDGRIQTQEDVPDFSRPLGA